MHQQTKKYLFLIFFLISSYVLITLIFNFTKFEFIADEKIDKSFYYNESIPDEIEPYCEGVDFETYNNLSFENINNLNIEIQDINSWIANIFYIYQENEVVINDKFKDTFKSKVIVNYGDFKCSFDAEIRISGDFKDHIDINDFTASMDIKLLSGHINEITKFKLFLPETRNSENEIIASIIMNELGFISPRTSYVNVNLKGVSSNIVSKKYIFQEKFSKEMVEYNKFREGPLVEANEEFFWQEKRKKGYKYVFENEIPLINAKILNKYWSRQNIISAEITVQAIEMFNKAIFNSYAGYRDMNYQYLGNNPDIIYQFDAANTALLATHGISNHQRKFYFNKLENQFYPVYYDGDSNFLISDNVIWRDDYLEIENLSKAAKHLEKNLKIKNTEFNDKLKKSGVEVTLQESLSYLQTFRMNLKKISSAKQTIKPKYLSFEINNKKIIYSDNFNYVFFDPLKDVLEVCDSNLNFCEIISENIELNEIFSTVVNFSGKEGYLIGKSKDSLLSKSNNNEWVEESLVQNIILKKIFNPEIIIDFENNIIDIEISKSNQRVLITGSGTLKDWTINLYGNNSFPNEKIRYDNNLLTGCLTLYKVKLVNLNINSENMHCEDSLNIINSSGKINNLNISNSNSDSLDIDFSDISINNLKVTNSGNDCADFSSGKYSILNFHAINCKDKGISIGEGTKLTIEKVFVENSKIGLAIKDSSVAKISELEIKDSNMCFALYRKKQEFGPSKLSVSKLNCLENTFNFIQNGSVFIND
jgi:hypothetical protein